MLNISSNEQLLKIKENVEKIVFCSFIGTVEELVHIISYAYSNSGCNILPLKTKAVTLLLLFLKISPHHIFRSVEHFEETFSVEKIKATLDGSINQFDVRETWIPILSNINPETEGNQLLYDGGKMVIALTT